MSRREPGRRGQIEQGGEFAAGGRAGGGTELRWVERFIPAAEAHLEELVQRLSVVDVQTMLVVHALLTLSACWLAFSRRWWTTFPAWLAVIGFSLLWFGVNNRWEGRILYEVSPHHGLTQADLLVPVLIAAALLVRGLRFLGRAWARRRQDRISAGIPSVFRVMWPRDGRS